MAKYRAVVPATRGKMTIMFYQVEADAETLQEGIRTFGEVMRRAEGLTLPGSFSPRTAFGSLPAPPPETDADVEGTSSASESVIDVTIASSRASRKPIRKWPIMRLEKELNLHPKGKPPLKAFVADKNPTNQDERITVCVYYMCKILELTFITSHHVYTCLKHIGVRTPNDLPEALRKIASRKGYVDTTKGTDLKTTNTGNNLVEHELPRRGVQG